MATQEQIQQAKIEYSTWSLEDFHKTPQKNLYKIARAFDIRTFTTPSGVVYSSKLTRANRTYLEKVLWEILEEYRAAQVTRSKQITHSKEFGTYTFKDLVTRIYEEFHQACFVYISSQDSSKGTLLASTVSAIGGRLASNIKLMPHYRTGEERTDFAHLADIQEAYKLLEEMMVLDPILGETMEKAYPYLKQGAKAVLADAYQYKKEHRAKREQEILQSDEMEVSVAKYLVWAKETLENIETKGKRGYWKRVSIALAIATGRRMNEIHHQETKVEKINDNWVWFTGQSKGKTYSKEFFKKYPAFAIPTLVSADLVIKGFQFLHDQDKIVEGDRIKVNKRFSSDLGKQFKIVKSEVGIPLELTFHENRDLYVQCASQFSAIPEVFQTVPNANKRDADYACYLLGEGRAVYGERYQLQKNLAFLSYQDKYLVTDRFNT